MVCVCIAARLNHIYIPEKGEGEGESQRETNMVVQDWEEK